MLFCSHPIDKTITTLLCVSLLYFSATGQDNSVRLREHLTKPPTLFKKNIPSSKTGTRDIFYERKKQAEKQLKLRSIESGFDSLQIRIWYDYALLNNKRLIKIEKNDKTWKAELYDFTVYSSYKNTETIATYKVKPIIPKSGWHDFITKMVEFKIMSLPNMNDIPGIHDDWDDGVTFNIEIATKDQYRFYSYHSPDNFKDKFWQAKEMTNILNLISTELLRRP